MKSPVLKHSTQTGVDDDDKPWRRFDRRHQEPWLKSERQVPKRWSMKHFNILSISISSISQHNPAKTHTRDTKTLHNINKNCNKVPGHGRGTWRNQNMAKTQKSSDVLHKVEVYHKTLFCTNIKSLRENFKKNSVKVGILSQPAWPTHPPYPNVGIPKMEKQIMFKLHFRLF